MTCSLDQISIPSPCQVSWESMTGDEKTRHCSHCDCKVYNLSRISQSEGERLLERTGERLCVQIERRPDGSVVTADSRVKSNRRTFGRWILMSAASLFGLAGCRKEEATAVKLGGAIALPTSSETVQWRGGVAPPTSPEQAEQMLGRVVRPK